jgi:DNA-binding NarL/FixJ family response regulator
MINAVFVRGANLVCRSAASQVLPGYLRDVAQRRVVRDHQGVIRRLQARNGLTPRETTILQLAVEGVGRAKIAMSLGISEGTAKWHIRSLLSKCEARSLVELSCNVLRSEEDVSAAADERRD